MKKQSPRSRSRTPIPVRHQFDHEVPTVIHHPEENMTALGRFTQRAIVNRKHYGGWIIGIVVGLLVLVVAWNLLTSRRSADAEVWARLETAKTPSDRVDLAKDYPNSPATTWALLQAATDYYNLALADLPNNQDVALPNLKKALDLFDQVEHQAPKDSPQAIVAALGKARTLEARNEIAKAIDQYELVAKNWPGTPEAVQAKQLADLLKDPEAATFYKDLYAYTPSKATMPGEMTLPPLGSGSFQLPSPGGSIPTTSHGPSALPKSFLNMPLELAPPTIVETKKQPSQDSPKTATPTPAPKAESPKPKATEPELPGEVFSPKADRP